VARIGQIAITVNGECCPKESTTFKGFTAVQRTFELVGGTATGVPGVEQLPDVKSIYQRARDWLESLEEQLPEPDEDAPPE